MNISVVGTGHLAEATAECCGEWFTLCRLKNADLVYFCVDTPVDENDNSDVDFVLNALYETLRQVREISPVLISSQVPVGFCAQVESEFPAYHFASQPENIRKLNAVNDFRRQERMIVGTRHDGDHDIIVEVLSKFTDTILWMSPESAECTKHVLNAFLATEIVFANEMAGFVQAVGANVDDVFRGFRSDARVGDGPLNPGSPYQGGTLARDIKILNQYNPGHLIQAVKASNDIRLTGAVK